MADTFGLYHQHYSFSGTFLLVSYEWSGGPWSLPLICQLATDQCRVLDKMWEWYLCSALRLTDSPLSEGEEGDIPMYYVYDWYKLAQLWVVVGRMIRFRGQKRQILIDGTNTMIQMINNQNVGDWWKRQSQG